MSNDASLADTPASCTDGSLGPGAPRAPSAGIVRIRLASARLLVSEAPDEPAELHLEWFGGLDAARVALHSPPRSFMLAPARLGLDKTHAVTSGRGWLTVGLGPDALLLFNERGELRYARLGAIESLGPGSWCITSAHVARAEASQADTRTAASQH